MSEIQFPPSPAILKMDHYVLLWDTLNKTFHQMVRVNVKRKVLMGSDLWSLHIISSWAMLRKGSTSSVNGVLFKRFNVGTLQSTACTESAGFTVNIFNVRDH